MAYTNCIIIIIINNKTRTTIKQNKTFKTRPKHSSKKRSLQNFNRHLSGLPSVLGGGTFGPRPTAHSRRLTRT